MRVAIIGAGPSGLTTLKHLLSAHEFLPNASRIEAKLFEAESSIGGTFRHRTYEDAELVSSRQLTTFSDYRYVVDSPDFLSTKEYCTYLEGYAKQFNLLPHIQLQTSVIKIRRTKNGHTVQYLQHGSVYEWTCDAVAICSGLHVVPNVPSIRGLEKVSVVMHSSQFKSREQFGIGKDIMVIGSGETGMDIAHLAITADTHSVTLCHRDGFLCAPKRAPEPAFFGMRPKSSIKGNVPYDVGAASLFDTAYVHPFLRDSFLPWAYYDRFAKYTTWLVSGTKAGLDQWIGEISPDRFHASKIFFNKSTKAMPYISSQYRSTSMIDRIRSFIAQVRIPDTFGRIIDLAPMPQEIDERGVVHFMSNGRPEAEVMSKKICRPDVVVLATGYTQNFPFLDKSYPRPQELDIRSIWKTGDESIGYIGFVRPSFGAIPPLAELQAQLWIMSITKQLKVPLEVEDHYRLRPAASNRIQYGVDHESYAYQLALDMGSAPSFTDIICMGWKMTLCWALSAQVNTKFRLVGPWKWSGARRVMETEIWETVTRRRGFFGHLTLSAMPIVLFGSLSFILYVYTTVLLVLKSMWKRLMLSVST